MLKRMITPFTKPNNNFESDIDIIELENNLTNDQVLRSYQLARDKEIRVVKLLRRYTYVDLIAYALTVTHKLLDKEPKTYKETIESIESDKLKAAMDEEIRSLKKN